MNICQSYYQTSRDLLFWNTVYKRYVIYTPFTLMRFKPRFSAVVEPQRTLQPQRTAGNRKYTADEPRVSVTFRAYRACSQKN